MEQDCPFPSRFRFFLYRAYFHKIAPLLIFLRGHPLDCQCPEGRNVGRQVTLATVPLVDPACLSLEIFLFPLAPLIPRAPCLTRFATGRSAPFPPPIRTLFATVSVGAQRATVCPFLPFTPIPWCYRRFGNSRGFPFSKNLLSLLLKTQPVIGGCPLYIGLFWLLLLPFPFCLFKPNGSLYDAGDFAWSASRVFVLTEGPRLCCLSFLVTI